MALPTKRQFLTNLIDAIPSIQDHDRALPQSQNPLSALQSHPTAKATFLTLHVLFPNELLPALDLLDRNLVHRMSITHASDQETPHRDPDLDLDHDLPTTEHRLRKAITRTHIYHVRSAQQASRYSRFHAPSDRDSDSAIGLGSFYEVRPYAWNCSCPAFVFGAFPSNAAVISSDLESDGHGQEENDGEVMGGVDGRVVKGLGRGVEREGWEVGGLTRGEDAPVCKHLLACVLVEHCGSLFGHFVQEREVNLEEMAGWAAGWGG